MIRHALALAALSAGIVACGHPSQPAGSPPATAQPAATAPSPATAPGAVIVHTTSIDGSSSADFVVFQPNAEAIAQRIIAASPAGTARLADRFDGPIVCRQDIDGTPVSVHGYAGAQVTCAMWDVLAKRVG